MPDGCNGVTTRGLDGSGQLVGSSSPSTILILASLSPTVSTYYTIHTSLMGLDMGRAAQTMACSNDHRLLAEVKVMVWRGWFGSFLCLGQSSSCL
eukprot:m.231599 g.231599  ORF g.231599 m.231599 type:complete len:95 (-) comp17366_c0_seq26:78-362(-)